MPHGQRRLLFTATEKTLQTKHRYKRDAAVSALEETLLCSVLIAWWRDIAVHLAAMLTIILAFEVPAMQAPNTLLLLLVLLLLLLRIPFEWGGSRKL